MKWRQTGLNREKNTLRFLLYRFLRTSFQKMSSWGKEITHQLRSRSATLTKFHTSWTPYNWEGNFKYAVQLQEFPETDGQTMLRN